jgi:hypothetical protein
MMQVAAADTYDDYVICRGYDPRDERFYDYEEGNSDKPGIPVAKPYGNRAAGAYKVGEVFPAVIPLTRIGQTAGVAETTQGHPADLDEKVEILKTDDGTTAINWLLLDSGSGIQCRYGILDEVMNAGSSATMSVWRNAATGSYWDGTWDEDSGENLEIYSPPMLSAGSIDAGKWVKAIKPGTAWIMDGAEC